MFPYPLKKWFNVGSAIAVQQIWAQSGHGVGGFVVWRSSWVALRLFSGFLLHLSHLKEGRLLPLPARSLCLWTIPCKFPNGGWQGGQGLKLLFAPLPLFKLSLRISVFDFVLDWPEETLFFLSVLWHCCMGLEPPEKYYRSGPVEVQLLLSDWRHLEEKEGKRNKQVKPKMRLEDLNDSRREKRGRV